MAADQSASTPKPKVSNSTTIKLMFNKRSSKILYAEAGKDFVDLLFSFLVLPTGAIAKQGLVSKVTKEEEQTKVPCITNLYKSVESLSASVMKTDKGVLLDPKVVSKIYTNDILCIQTPPPAPSPRYYVCNNLSYGSLAHSLSTQSGTATCPCGYPVNHEVKMADKSPVSGKDPLRLKGYVKETANFVITDDLSVMPVNSTATIVQLWHKLDVQEPTDLREQNVTVGPNEVTLLLKAAMVSNTVLNDVFKADSKYSSTVDMDRNEIPLQEVLLKMLTGDLKYRGSKGTV